MARHHRSKNHTRRRRMRGGVWWNPLSWGKTEDLPPAKIAEAVAPALPSAPAQATALGAPAGSASVLGPTASTATALGGRRKTRKHRKTRRRH
jgi:hypothetical protein